MSDEDKAPFERSAEQDKQRYRAECLAAGIEVSDVVDAKPALYYYLKSQRIAIAEANPEAGPAELMQMMRQNFAALSEEERAPFEEEAAADKTRHEQETAAEAPPPPPHTPPRPARAPLRGVPPSPSLQRAARAEKEADGAVASERLPPEASKQAKEVPANATTRPLPPPSVRAPLALPCASQPHSTSRSPGRRLCRAARCRRVGWVLPHPRSHHRRRRVELGAQPRWLRCWPLGPRR